MRWNYSRYIRVKYLFKLILLVSFSFKKSGYEKKFNYPWLARICGLLYISMGWPFTEVMQHFYAESMVPRGSPDKCASSCPGSPVLPGIMFWGVCSDSLSIPLLSCVSPTITPPAEPWTPPNCLSVSSSPLLRLSSCWTVRSSTWGLDWSCSLPYPWHEEHVVSSTKDWLSYICLNELMEWIQLHIHTEIFLPDSWPHNSRKFLICYDQDSERSLKKVTEETTKVNVALSIIFSYITYLYLYTPISYLYLHMYLYLYLHMYLSISISISITICTSTSISISITVSISISISILKVIYMFMLANVTPI